MIKNSFVKWFRYKNKKKNTTVNITIGKLVPTVKQSK